MARPWCLLVTMPPSHVGAAVSHVLKIRLLFEDWRHSRKRQHSSGTSSVYCSHPTLNDCSHPTLNDCSHPTLNHRQSSPRIVKHYQTPMPTFQFIEGKLASSLWPNWPLAKNHWSNRPVGLEAKPGCPKPSLRINTPLQSWRLCERKKSDKSKDPQRFT